MNKISKYCHLFFDLDQTLWDFEKCSEETLKELYIRYSLDAKIPDCTEFIRIYRNFNRTLWDLFSRGVIDKNDIRDRRFKQTLNHFGYTDAEMIEQFATDYINLALSKQYLMPYALQTLEYLKLKYEIHIITNGFEEAQHKKINSSGISKFFGSVITSESAGLQKPQKGIFYHALEKSGASIDNSLMIGDSLLADIQGACSIGMDQVFYNPKKFSHTEKPTFEISCLSELQQFL